MSDSSVFQCFQWIIIALSVYLYVCDCVCVGVCAQFLLLEECLHFLHISYVGEILLIISNLKLDRNKFLKRKLFLA